MKLLNRTFPAPVRALLSGFVFVAGWISSARITLAAAAAQYYWCEGELKHTARRLAWYSRRGWLGIDVLPDDYFDFTEKMRDTQLAAAERFLTARAAKLDRITLATDRAFIAARRLDNSKTKAARANNAVSFKDACDVLLACDASQGQRAPKSQKARQGDFPIADAKQTLADFIALFPQHSLRWFFVSGTFLGLIRENGFLAHDYDIDLGVFEDEIDIPAVIDTITQSDRFVLKKYDHHQSSLFRPDVVSQNPDIPYILKIIHATGIHIDLFIHYRDTRVAPANYWHGSSLHRWDNSAFELASYSFYGHTVLGPANADVYLTENYGDWRTPVTEFNCTTDTPNLALVPHPVAIVIFLKRYVLAKGTDAQNAKKLEHELTHNGFLTRTPGSEPVFCSHFFTN